MTEEKAAPRSALKEWGKSIAIAVVIWLFLKIFLVEAFRIPSPSMENTLLPGDFLFVNKAIYGAVVPFTSWRLPAFREPARGDVVVFDSVEEEGMDIVKRVIGVAGDTLEMREGQVYRNGELQAEPFVVHTDITKSESPRVRAQMRAWQVSHLVGVDPATYQPDLQDWGPIVVPADSFFVMGDNRDESYDGRYWGFLPRRNIRGTPIVIYYSYNPDSWRSLKFLTAIRWDRLLHHPS